jgi:dihydropyrimidinase
MADATYDLVIRNGTVGTSSGAFPADVAIKAETIAAVGTGLGRGAREIDATGMHVLPGGIDAHCHIEQMSAAGIMNADTFESATEAAAFGGTTTVISFAAQHVGLDLDEVLADYGARARRGAVIDYCFHLIVADPTEKLLKHDLPAAIRAGHRSIKAFMTYDRIRLHDEQLLDVMAVAKAEGALLCVHAENHGMIKHMVARLYAEGKTSPKWHATSHPRESETEAFERLISMSRLMDQPVVIFHVSTAEGAAIVARAKAEGARVKAETCPQYLFFTAADLDKPGLEGAKWMCSPPPREAADQTALRAALSRGDLDMVTSDHAPYAFDATGKLKAGPNATFKEIANGVPGLEQRLPLLYDAFVSKQGGEGLAAFVRLTATAAAETYGLTSKGAIAPGKDADIAIWDPAKRVTFTDAAVRDLTRYTPYAGRAVTGYPTTVLRRGAVIVADGKLHAPPGSGKWLHRDGVTF